ncbi:MAG: NB-ARC domain-containing protein [Phormidesmis sp.]
MTLPEDSDSLNIRQDIDGDGNQVIAKMTGESKAGVGGRDVIFEQHNHIYPVKERTTFLFQLPLSADDFTGRQKELDLIYTALNKSGQSGTVVISAVSGMAGVGKSALAVYAAHQMAERFPDAQLYVNLQGADAKPADPNDVLGEWLRDLGMDGAEIPMAQAEREKCYRSLLAGKRVLILLDNAHDAAQVKPLLPGSGKCAVILTSRRLLSELVGTQPIPLDPLEDEDALKLLAKLADEERVAAEPQAAEEIVRLCGYLPLAVRIAGGVLKGKKHWRLGADYLPRLADERGRLDALKQVQGEDVRASFNLSYQQLDEAERRLFGLLGALEGNFGLWLAAAVSEMEVAAAKESVERLIDAQLVEVTQQGRYQYHDLMRLYARDWLSVDERQTLAEKAFDWYWGGANYFENAFDPQRRREVAAKRYSEMAEKEREETFYQEALSWFEVERPHLLAAFEWGYAHKRHSEIVSFAGNLWPFFQARSYWQDWVHTHELALVGARNSNNRQGESQTLNNLGMVYQLQGRWEDAIAQYEQSLEICRSLGNRHSEGLTLENLGNLHQARIQPLKANEYWQEALTKLHPDSPEAKRLTQQLNNPFSQISPKQLAIGCAPQLALLLFAAFNLLRGHWLIALLALLAIAAFHTYRIWKLRRGNR